MTNSENGPTPLTCRNAQFTACARAVSRRLAEAGASAKEIMAVTGHQTLSEVQRYVDAADNPRLAEQGMARLRKRGRDSA